MWGTASDESDNIVWGTMTNENIVWGALFDLRSVRGSSNDDEDNIVWGTSLIWATAAWSAGARKQVGSEGYHRRFQDP